MKCVSGVTDFSVTLQRGGSETGMSSANAAFSTANQFYYVESVQWQLYESSSDYTCPTHL